jgi:hypothetical protein
MASIAMANADEACEFLSSDLVVPYKIARQLEDERDALVKNFIHNTQLLMDVAYGLYVEDGVAIEEATRKEIGE